MEDQAFLPDLPIVYPEDNPTEQLVKIIYNTDERIVFDENYPYLDDSWEFRKQNLKCYTGLFGFVMWYAQIRYGLKIKNRKVLRKYRKELKNGAITISNHVFRFDMVFVLNAIRFRRSWIPILAEHLMGTEKWFMRSIGGIPVPDTRQGLKAFDEAFDELHRRKAWIHFFPEARSWKCYAPIRPFKKGAFAMAYKYDLPIIPCVLSYRKRTGIYKFFEKDMPLFTLTMCDPIFPDKSVPRRDDINRMRETAHAMMVKAAGIKNNPWPASGD